MSRRWRLPSSLSGFCIWTVSCLSSAANFDVQNRLWMWSKCIRIVFERWKWSKRAVHGMKQERIDHRPTQVTTIIFSIEILATFRTGFHYEGVIVNNPTLIRYQFRWRIELSLARNFTRKDPHGEFSLWLRRLDEMFADLLSASRQKESN